ncbi:hypothetical protein OSB04_029488 [Centaurea solstitialis]|uniref:Reverse transcriptase Ty1/copia-type domain-containing protein n=1 Tax=Centaurea solstitialis TaxID=347529 RepID=A0AA38T1A0_9ASTR|nr:hypothetical protein OSB04_029488 [Centaurea solstitialis]
MRTLIAVVAQRNWTVYQLDVKSAFLNGELKEVVHVAQPKGFIKKGDEAKVYRLKHALYGLKQAPRAWFNRIEGYFIHEGFKKSAHDHTLFVKKSYKRSMQLEFEMTDLGKMKFFLGVEVSQNSEGISLCQSRYANEVLRRFEMWEANDVKNPILPDTNLMKLTSGKDVNNTKYMSLIGSLMYLTVTRPDLMYVVRLLSRLMAKPNEEHMAVAKRVLRSEEQLADLDEAFEVGRNLLGCLLRGAKC